jgi:hypothetical protein
MTRGASTWSRRRRVDRERRGDVTDLIDYDDRALAGDRSTKIVRLDRFLVGPAAQTAAERAHFCTGK